MVAFAPLKSFSSRWAVSPQRRPKGGLISSARRPLAPSSRSTAVSRTRCFNWEGIDCNFTSPAARSICPPTARSSLRARNAPDGSILFCRARDVDFAELLEIHFHRRVRHEVAAPVVLREGDDFADGFRADG